MFNTRVRLFAGDAGFTREFVSDHSFECAASEGGGWYDDAENTNAFVAMWTKYTKRQTGYGDHQT